jgi:hypothetical protein
MALKCKFSFKLGLMKLFLCCSSVLISEWCSHVAKKKQKEACVMLMFVYIVNEVVFALAPSI